MKNIYTRSFWLCTILGLFALTGCNPLPPIPTEPKETTPIIEVPTPTPVPRPQSTPVPEEKTWNLDTDGNGLYDPRERKELLDLFLTECPELQPILNRAALPVAKAANEDYLDFADYSSGKALEERKDELLPQQNFDLNADGQVTIAEQAHNRPPLSMLVPTRIVDSSVKIPWGIDIFPEWITTAYMQEDLNLGEVDQYMPRGVVKRNAIQPSPSMRPRLSAIGAGLEFPANSGAYLSMKGHRDSRWNYRWCLLTFRIDASSGSSDSTVLVDLNRGKGSNMSTPKIWYVRNEGLKVQYVGENIGGLDYRLITADNVVADGKTWNVVVCGIRYGQLYASVNGVPMHTDSPQPPRFASKWQKDTDSYIGDEFNQGNMAWAMDALVFGLTEPSEAMVKKLTGWAAHRLNFAENLPESDPYRSARPVLDMEDFPSRYVHNDPKWNAWGRATKDKSITRVNQGGPRVKLQGFERVFHDDFRANRVKPSTSGEGDLWVGPGFNIAVGAKAQLVTPGDKPDVYPHSESKMFQGLSLARQGKRWRGSAFYSINDQGQGYTWAGPKIFRIRFMFPKIDPAEVPPGLFPAFWSYAPENLWWRTSNRTEIDYFEFDGKNGYWLNGLSSHYHYPYLKGEDNIFAKNTQSYQRFKVYGGELKPEKSKMPETIFAWDGKFRTWEFVIDEDMTYVNVTVADGMGGERWVEVVRCPTTDLYLQELNLQLDYALKSYDNMPEDQDRLDFIVSFIEVFQKTEDIMTLPDVYTARPQITGVNRPGSVITCDPKLTDGITDVRYFWYADDYPLSYGPSNSYTLTYADAGKRIRCMVKAVGARDRPNAWSNVLY
ncbi:hypothetical protein P3T73_12520 [Kiritimatiellota bacterium B12222]|nr:hypothetical protein P3T73_12520 [Kiritimatiellota bacterium B12222]